MEYGKPAIFTASNLIYGSKCSFKDYKNIRKYKDLSFTIKYDKLLSFYHRLNEFRNLIPGTEKTKIKKKNVYENFAILCNLLLTIYFNDYNNTAHEKRNKGTDE